MNFRDRSPVDSSRSEAEKLAGTRPFNERVVNTHELLGNQRRVWIEHATERYLLQVTRAGKLILTK